MNNLKFYDLVGKQFYPCFVILEQQVHLPFIKTDIFMLQDHCFMLFYLQDWDNITSHCLSFFQRV